MRSIVQKEGHIVKVFRNQYFSYRKGVKNHILGRFCRKVNIQEIILLCDYFLLFSFLDQFCHSCINRGYCLFHYSIQTKYSKSKTLISTLSISSWYQSRWCFTATFNQTLIGESEFFKKITSRTETNINHEFRGRKVRSRISFSGTQPRHQRWAIHPASQIFQHQTQIST